MAATGTERARKSGEGGGAARRAPLRAPVTEGVLGFFGELSSAVENLNIETHRFGESTMREAEAATLHITRQASDPLQSVHSAFTFFSQGAASQGQGLLRGLGAPPEPPKRTTSGQLEEHLSSTPTTTSSARPTGMAKLLSHSHQSSVASLFGSEENTRPPSDEARTEQGGAGSFLRRPGHRPPARRRVVDNGCCSPQEADKIQAWLSRVDHRGASAAREI